MIIDGITLPDDPRWIPNVDRANEIGEDLLAVAWAALKQQEQFGDRNGGVSPIQSERYERRYVGHGSRIVVPYSKSNQLSVFLPRLFVGRAGEEQFQFAKGQSGKLAFQTARYSLELSQPWPPRQSERPVKTTDIDEARARLWRDGYIVWASMVALAAGAVIAPRVKANDVAVGPMVPRDPSGAVGSWAIDIQVELN